MDIVDLRQKARNLMDHYNLQSWRFKLNTNKSRLGVCKFRSKSVEVQEYYAMHNPESEVMDTVKHEIAHALVGPGHGHGPVWKAMAIKLGCTPKSCGGSHVKVKEGDWKAQCPTCLKKFNMHRRPKRLIGKYCGVCGSQKGRIVFQYGSYPTPTETLQTLAKHKVVAQTPNTYSPPTFVPPTLTTSPPPPPIPNSRDVGRRWRAVCPGCNHVYIYLRKPKRLTGMHCPKCGPIRGSVTFRLHVV